MSLTPRLELSVAFNLLLTPRHDLSVAPRLGSAQMRQVGTQTSATSHNVSHVGSTHTRATTVALKHELHW